MTYLDLLPDELYRERIAKLLFADVLHQLEYGHGVPVYPIDFYYCFCSGNSDYVRSRYLNTKWREVKGNLKGPNSLRTRDWYKLLMDLERPTVWTSAVHGWKVYSVRRWQAINANGQLMGGLYWNSTYEKPHLSMAGWCRLSNTLSMDAYDACHNSQRLLCRGKLIRQVSWNNVTCDYDDYNEYTNLF